MTSMYKKPRSQFGEISQQASVVIQCSHDKKDTLDRMNAKKSSSDDYYMYGEPTLDQAVVRIDIGDLVFQVGTSSAPRGSILNGAIPVTSHLNGLYVRRNGNDPKLDDTGSESEREFKERMRNLKLSNGIRFIGAALGSTTPNPDDLADQKTQLTVRTQGTMSIFHSGDTNLRPGDTLVWKIPTKKEMETFIHRFGRSMQKIPLMTAPMRKEYDRLDVSILKVAGKANDKQVKKDIVTSVDIFASKLVKLLGVALNNGNVDADDYDSMDPSHANHNSYDKRATTAVAAMAAKPMFQSAVKELVSALSGVMLDVEKRKIGKVLSYAKPGDKVDVLIGSG